MMTAEQRAEKLANIRAEIRASLYPPKLLAMVQCIEEKKEDPYHKFSDYGTYQRHVFNLRAKEQNLISRAIAKLDSALIADINNAMA